ncbi:LacI family DNA-binding transcriptional regulator [Cognatishimia activa]|uniref:Gluconate utilization system GNT-I transcriptional repressor n=1 Tax=Cognatishimia activa TaxID=1715691 RepID=A0A0P1IQU7_9RHOB|nr:LacI family DNA-binding transcriptional regulator [Cognatishimia activa]CUI95184.1 Gluconate utilization system GNT-I transcriptional repressor [Cognatishimia activa]CUK25909.1 Gluconate utilization system GNT-I transcriptional repressor [Cognatishimia activa]
MTKRLNLKDVADLVGVSEMTASRALRGAPDVSEKTRLKVEEAARSIGYVPNRIAGSLSSQSVNLVAVVVPSLNSYVFPEVLSGISSVLKDSPLKPVVGVSGYDLDEEEGVIREMLSWRPSGLVVAGLEHTDNTRQMLQSAHCPVVEVMDTDGDPVGHCVGISHKEAGRAMGRQILERGFRRIGFIGTKMPQDFRAIKRLDGFCEALNEAGVSLLDQEHYSGDSTIQTGRDLTANLLARSPDLDCLYYSSDVMTVGGYMHCLAAGLSIPTDIALAGFNNLQILEGLPLSLATTDACRREIGVRAAEIILSDLANEGPRKFEQMQPKIALGESL